MENKRILLVFRDSVLTCPRPKRLLNYLSRHNQMSVLSTDYQPFSEFKHFWLVRRQISPLFKLCLRWLVKLGFTAIAAKLEEARFRTNLTAQCLAKFDYIFVHDLSLLPLFKAQRHKVIFDAREYYPLMFAEKPEFRVYDAKIYDYLCRTLLPLFPCKLTVSQSVADEYQSNYGVGMYNFPSYPLQSFISNRNLPASETSKGPLRIIYHGAAHKDRNIEKLIQLGDLLTPEIELHLMLKPYDRVYFKQLKNAIEKSKNVTLLPPVNFEGIIRFISEYDIGIHLLENRENQHAISLPNKFFEYLGAGLMLITSGSREMYYYVNEFKLGYAFEEDISLEVLADKINHLNKKQVDHYKGHNSETSGQFVFEKAAPELLSYIEATLSK